MGFIFLVGSIQAFFFISLILTKKNKQAADLILLIWLFAMGIHLLSYYALYNEMFNTPGLKYIILLLPPLIYVHGPLLYIYAKYLTGKSSKFHPKYLLHFIPFTVSLCFYIYLLVFKAEGDFTYLASRPIVSQYLTIIFYLLNIFLNPLYVVIVLVILSDHRQKIKLNFSYLERIDLNWLKFLAIGLGSISIIVWIVHVMSNFNILNLDFNRDFYIFISITLFVFVLGFFGFRQGIIYKFPSESIVYNDTKSKLNQSQSLMPDRKQKSDNSKYKKSQLTEKEAKKIIERLNKYMENDKPYKQNTLALLDVATTLNVSAHTLSQVLNIYMKNNFYNYINTYRVNEVKDMLMDTKYDHFSHLGVALEAGFNSKSAFNRIFKNITGQTPTQYKDPR